MNTHISIMFVREGAMKLIATLAFVAGGVLSGYSQIPNASFENWTDDGSIVNPLGWFNENASYQSENFKMVETSTDAIDGSLAVVLQNQQLGSGMVVRSMIVSGSGDLSHSPGFSYHQKPASLNGYFRFESTQFEDSCYVIVQLSKYNQLNHRREIVGEATLASNEHAGYYQHFSLPITYHSFDLPDTATIICYSGRMVNPYAESRMTIDDLSFDESTTGVVIIDGDELGVIVSPNPANNIITISNPSIVSSARTYSIYDNSGKLVIQKNLNGRNIDVGSLSNGTYNLYIYNSTWVVIGYAAFVMQH